MRRTLNQTGRQRILMQDVTATPVVDGPNRSVIFSWDLSAMALPADAEVIIEVSLTGQSMRFVASKVEDGISTFEAKVAFLRDAKSAKSKLYVSKNQSNGTRLILATTTNIPIVFEKEPDGGNSPLQIQLIDNLSTVWRLDYDSGKPVLQVSNSDGMYAQLKNNPIFFPTILPQVIKEIAFHLLSSPEDFGSEGDIWNQFFKSYGLSDEEREFLQSESDEAENLSNERWDMAEAISIRFSIGSNVIEEIKIGLGEES